jgi:hypothetical protein
MSKMSIRNWDSFNVIELADANPDGFTVDIVTGEKVTSGYAVAMTHGLTPEDAAVVANLVALGSWMPNTVYKWTIGGWRDGDKYIIDIGFVTRWEEGAIAFGKYYNQDAIYNLNTNECITLKGE